MKYQHIIHRLSKLPLAIKIGLFATFVGLIAFTLNWNFYDVWGGPMPGYQILLFPGNMSLVYVWHPIFTEEVNLYPKLGMILFGQFVIVSASVEIVRRVKSLVQPWIGKP